MSGSVSRSKNDPSQSLQMIERPLMTPDELKSMPKGQFVVMKTGFRPMKVKLKLFFKWGIQFDEKNPYTAENCRTARYPCIFIFSTEPIRTESVGLQSRS